MSRYQTTPESHSEATPEQVFAWHLSAPRVLERYSKLAFLTQVSPRTTLETKRSHLGALGRGNDSKDRSHFKTGLTRSKSTGSLQIKVASIHALRARFESKEDTQKKVTSNQPSSRSVGATLEKTKEAEQVKIIQQQ